MDPSNHLSGFGSGKVILLGEHSVVYGHPALAGPLSRGVTARGEPAGSCQLTISNEVAAGHHENLRRAFAQAAQTCGNPGVKVSFDSDLPLSMGLGSSGALAVALARVLLQAAGRETSLDAVARMALEMEQVFHGTPSGVDHTTSVTGQLILYSREPGTSAGQATVVASPKPVNLVVVIAGERSSTKATVGALRERQKRWPERYHRVFREMGVLASEGARAVEQGDLEWLGDVMNFNHGQLVTLGLSSPKIDGVVHQLRALGALGAKLTGAGGDGGAVIGLFHETAPVVEALTRQGLQCFDSQLAGPQRLSGSVA